MKVKKALKVIYYAIIVFIIAIAALLVVSVFPITGNLKFMIVQSGSMDPDIKAGSIVMTKPSDSYKIGDVISFSTTTREEPITHRIHEMKVVEGRVYYTTKGDANEEPDAREVPQRDVIGKVIFSVPYVGYAVDFVQKPLGFALIIIIPAGLIIFDEVRKIYHEVRKIKAKKEIKEIN